MCGRLRYRQKGKGRQGLPVQLQRLEPIPKVRLYKIAHCLSHHKPIDVVATSSSGRPALSRLVPWISQCVRKDCPAARVGMDVDSVFDCPRAPDLVHYCVGAEPKSAVPNSPIKAGGHV
jgi:hypothetical protein